jgi:hypothetical protein
MPSSEVLFKKSARITPKRGKGSDGNKASRNLSPVLNEPSFGRELNFLMTFPLSSMVAALV